ncbi:amidohydrolase [Pseudomonas chengduensis]|jgi:predicted TIM-barrel fold metal-dependent hydrolase|uniref:Amidohydrolase n=1 Tax=Ectopseudomonas mendocina TaxID=300 RepID=A0ABD7RS10_ECTME|nr:MULTISPECIES: amidohydrolase family protein [Pseudomonas]MDH1209530.1 amidohydrolase [Pseudomonas chengduensis]OZB33918.1 MAG: amidohydrolase [Pseudomonas sp. 34-62-33]TRO11940.1 amidohydrolase [Pseudomonas mendocina]TRO13914.1 amidohydrolase [Pseudomonas mendocina]
MKLEDMILVSVDDHAIEPAGAFDRHMPERFKGLQPRVEQHGGRDVWVFEGQATGYMGLNSVVGRPKEEYGMEPLGYEHMRRGTWDIKARVDDMSANGILGSICFPTFPGFAGQRFQNHPNRDVSLAAIQAYNDWHLHDWCNAAPGRFIPLMLVPWWDMQAAAAEVTRLAKLGVHALSFSDNPALHGFPSIHSDYWDPLWKACADNNVVICCHIGTGIKAEHASDLSPIDAWITSMPISIANSAADWIWAPMWKKFPDLRMALSEGGIGWIPYLLERADFTHRHHHAWTNADFGGKKPSDIFRKHFITCFIEDDFGLRNLPDVGEDMVTWECDYPHSDCTWPHSPEVAWESLKRLPKAAIDKVTHLNAMREFSYDPFAILGRENCTVGALRAQATHVSTEPALGMGGAAPKREKGKPVTSGDINAMFAQADAQTAL